MPCSSAWLPQGRPFRGKRSSALQIYLCRGEHCIIMPATKELRFYCDRCGALYGTSGEDGLCPPRDQVFLAMSAIEQHVDKWCPEPRYLAHYDMPHKAIIHGPHEVTYAQVCRSCFSEFKIAEGRMREWWAAGKKLIATVEPVPQLREKPSPRVLAAAAVTQRKKG